MAKEPPTECLLKDVLIHSSNTSPMVHVPFPLRKSNHPLRMAMELSNPFREVIGVPKSSLVGGFNPFEKYYKSKWESSPSRGENKTYLKPPPR